MTAPKRESGMHGPGWFPGAEYEGQVGTTAAGPGLARTGRR